MGGWMVNDGSPSLILLIIMAWAESLELVYDLVWWNQMGIHIEMWLYWSVSTDSVKWTFDLNLIMEKRKTGNEKRSVRVWITKYYS